MFLPVVSRANVRHLIGMVAWTMSRRVRRGETARAEGEKALMAAPLPDDSFLGTVALVFLAIAILSAVDMFLAGLERKETRIEAHNLFARGVT